MKLKRPARPAHSETIIALIDVVFFLLVFFMLIGRMDATAPFEVSPPVAQSGTDMPAGGATLSVARDGALALDGTGIDRDRLGGRLAEMLARDPDLRLRVNAHREAELRHVLPLVGLAEATGIRDVVLVVTPRPEPG
ncbi:ExbD/TolR family protein [Pukyongiella litopenaei]|uniref:Biopolymer transporter ExbD n=1 Tax=Pukyongiella litopenaei TaxID=2605946 RepID=A0A2S0MPD0_9RHOB|nr:biopolymer transporter ExbD [Pukyongiella litopenaei]AVO37696.1 biopolymer transporter ExbD [Pukyongiella litopenaei]